MDSVKSGYPVQCWIVYSAGLSQLIDHDRCTLVFLWISWGDSVHCWALKLATLQINAKFPIKWFELGFNGPPLWLVEKKADHDVTGLSSYVDGLEATENAEFDSPLVIPYRSKVILGRAFLRNKSFQAWGWIPSPVWPLRCWTCQASLPSLSTPRRFPPSSRTYSTSNVGSATTPATGVTIDISSVTSDVAGITYDVIGVISASIIDRRINDDIDLNVDVDNVINVVEQKSSTQRRKGRTQKF